MRQTWWNCAKLAGAVGILAVACTWTAWADEEGGGDVNPPPPANKDIDPVKPAFTGPAAPVTDEQVVASMKKGIDYLLSVKKEDNWEISDGPAWVPDREKGGQTAIVLYALLHSAESLQDNPDYRAKLGWRGKELAPVISWMLKNPPQDTYVVGLEASALTLLPKIPNEKPGEGVRGALDTCRLYLVGAMGTYGGYTYTWPVRVRGGYATLADFWDAYYMAKTSGAKQKETTMRRDMDNYMIAAAATTGGQQLEIQRLILELKNRLRSTNDPKYEGELRELEAYSHSLPPPLPYEGRHAAAKAKYDDLLTRQKNGDLTIVDPDDKLKRITLTAEEFQKKVDNAKQWLEKIESEKGGFYPEGDLSNGQYGTLGAWALMDYGIEMPTAYWAVQDKFWRLLQREDGSWPYNTHRSKESKDTMGVAGLASLFVTQEFTDTELRLVPKPDKNMDAGLAWLNASYTTGTGNLYYMYGVERVGLASGLKFFGTTNWYKEGAADLVRQQTADGSWHSQFNPHVGTAYALLFLARGRNPVVFNKLQYSGPWNARPRDDAYVTRWMSKRFEKPINWQVVNLQVSAEDWLDAPILLITGSVDPKFTKADVEKLRTFINAGGMIFSTADGGKAEFTTAMKRYAGEVVEKKYEMRVLPKDHPLFSKELGVDLPNPPPLLGMSNGSRELWIHSTADVGADWQTRKFASKNFELGAALYFYASGMGSLRSKLQPLAVEPGTEAATRTMGVARVDYAGNSDPEPGAWARMAKLAQAKFKTQVNLTTVKFSGLDPKQTPLAYLTGTARVTFSDEEVQGLKGYLDGGGLLFVDAAGGSAEFTSSCQELIKQVYPEAELAALPVDHPIFAGTMPDGVKLEVEFRKYGNLRLHRRVTAPAMDGIVVNGRTRVLFSPWDVCSGFLGTNTWGIVGYSTGTSEALGRNILLYSLNPVAAAPGGEKIVPVAK